MRSTVGALGLACFVLVVSSLLPPRPGSGPAPLVGVAAEPARPTTRPAHSAAAPIGVASLTRDQQAAEAMRRKLATPVNAMEFDAKPLREVLDYLQAEGGVTISPNWKTLEAVNITPDTEVIGKLPNASLATALRIVLENISDPGCNSADYVLLDGAIRISTQEDLNRYTEIRVYDCRDLIQRPLSTEQRKTLESIIRQEYGRGVATPGMEGAAPGAMMGGGAMGGYGASGMGAGGYGGAAPEEDPTLSAFEQTLVRVTDALRKRDAQDLVALVKSTVAPETWDSAGIGISEFDGLLVVRQNAKAQEGVSELFAMLREAKAARTKAAEPERTARVPAGR